MKSFIAPVLFVLVACGGGPNDGSDVGQYAARHNLTVQGVSNGAEQASVATGDQYADARHDVAEGYALDRDGLGADANDARQTAGRDGLTTDGAEENGSDFQTWVGQESAVTRNYFWQRGPANVQNGRQAK